MNRDNRGRAERPCITVWHQAVLPADEPSNCHALLEWLKKSTCRLEPTLGRTGP